MAKKKATKKKKAPKAVGPVGDVTRYIKEPVKLMLWGKAAGRCEFSGCNKPLWKSPVTLEQVNIAERAHIYAFSSGGARGNRGVPRKKLNDLDNLMLACHDCHRKMDQEPDGGRYTAKLLQQWKKGHERRVEIVTGIDPKKGSHVVLYGANIGSHSSPLNFSEAGHALFPQHYPTDDRPIELGTTNNSFQDRNPRFWEIEAENLTTLFNQRVRERITSGDVKHLSVFALAPQPLLILLGTLMIDITNAEVFQRHREPQTWGWPDKAVPLQFEVQRPSSFDGPPALVIALSAPVTDDRITAVLGDDTCIWKVTIPNPNNDHIRSRKDLSNFRTLIRDLIDEIKLEHGQTTPLHIFPVAAVSASIELGRVRMPKAHMPWKIYDQNNDLGGFVEAIAIPDLGQPEDAQVSSQQGGHSRC